MRLHASRHPSARLDRFPLHAGGRPDRGVTLIELLIVVAIIGILVVIAVPSFASLLSRHRAATAINDLSHAIAFTRSEALKRSRRVYLAPTGARWRDGWAVFVDRDDDRRFGPEDEAIMLHDALPPSVTVGNSSGAATEPFVDPAAPPRVYIAFDGGGYPRRRNGALSPGGFVVTDRTGAVVTVRTLCLASYGRVRIIVDHAGCS